MAAPPIRLMLLLVLALATPRTMDAQPRVPQARMDDFVRALADGDPDPFFPRRGGLAWVLTTHRADSVSVGRWRFDAADLPRALGGGGPLCQSFTLGGDVIPLHSLHYNARRTPGRWRRVGVNRFVPPGASAGSATFVQWRREDGRWVVDAFGNEVVLAPRLLGMQRGGVVRDPGGPLAYPLPADGVYAAGTWWYEQNEVITVDGARLHRYGPPRRLDPGSVRRFGYLEGVEVYVEPRYSRIPEVLFVALSADGVFQPYQNMAGDGCTAPAPPLAVARDPGGPLAYPLPADALYAAGTWWYEENHGIRVDGVYLVKFGHPLRLDAGEVRRIGYLEGVEVYAEPRDRGTPEVVYVPVSADGVFQPYQNTADSYLPDAP